MFVYEYSVKHPLRRDANKMIEYLFCFISFGAMVVIIALGISFEYYKTHLLVQYVFLVWFAYNFIKDDNIIKSISLSFLLVFLNSYFWEMMLHFIEYTVNIMKIFNFRETAHLIVVPFLVNHYDFKWKVVRKYTQMNIILSYIIATIKINFLEASLLALISVPFFNHLGNVPYVFNRFMSLYILVRIIKSSRENHKKGWFIND